MADAAAEAIARARAIAARLAGEKRPREDAPNEPSSSKKTALATKRLWMSTTEQRPAAHFVRFLQDSDEQQSSLSRIEHVQKQVRDKYSDESFRVELRGRGAPNQVVLPGVPLEPLHLNVHSSDPRALQYAEQVLAELLTRAEQAEPMADASDATDAIINTHNGDDDDNTHRGVSNYRPASVAMMIHNTAVPDLDTANLIQDVILVPNNLVGFVIGRGGENIQQLQAKTQCRLQIQKEADLRPGQTTREITLQANSQKAIDACRLLIEKMVQERSGTTPMTSTRTSNNKDYQVEQAIAMGHAHLTINVPDEDVGLVIGKQGTTIKGIQEATNGASIVIPQTGDENGQRIIQITHPEPLRAQQAKDMIENILKSKPSFHQNNKNSEPATSIQVSMPDKDVGLIIGRQGCVIKQLQQMTNTKILIPSQGIQGVRIATVTGAAEACAQVQRMIHQIVADQSSASVMSGGAMQQNYYSQQSGDGYSATEWAAYRAAQAAAAAVTETSYPASHYSAQASTAQYNQQPEQQLAPDAYYEQFFRYAYYYGEEAARQYYGAWSPPPGTPNPYGVNPNGITAAPTAAAAPEPSAATTTEQADARDTSKRHVSNLPAWMTKK